MDWVKNMLVELKKSIDAASAKARGDSTGDRAKAAEPLKQQTLW
ncbi:hypothetical protein [Bradyrhizobium sp. 177]|nr:hypothetical protein [Bradyrhizobium sp. 177]